MNNQPEINSSLYVNPDGELIKYYDTFLQEERRLVGVKKTELYCDAYRRNVEKSEQALFPAEECVPPFEVDKHTECRREFIRKGGGFRIDFLTQAELNRRTQDG